MNTKQLLNLCVALSVVVYFSISSEAFGKKSDVVVMINPLLLNSPHAIEDTEEQDTNSVVVQENLTKQLEVIQEKLDKLGENFVSKHQQFPDLEAEGLSNSEILKIKKVDEGLVKLSKKLDVFKKNKHKQKLFTENNDQEDGVELALLWATIDLLEVLGSAAWEYRKPLIAGYLLYMAVSGLLAIQQAIIVNIHMYSAALLPRIEMMLSLVETILENANNMQRAYVLSSSIKQLLGLVWPLIWAWGSGSSDKLVTV